MTQLCSKVGHPLSLSTEEDSEQQKFYEDLVDLKDLKEFPHNLGDEMMVGWSRGVLAESVGGVLEGCLGRTWQFWHNNWWYIGFTWLVLSWCVWFLVACLICGGNICKRVVQYLSAVLHARMCWDVFKCFQQFYVLKTSRKP